MLRTLDATAAVAATAAQVGARAAADNKVAFAVVVPSAPPAAPATALVTIIAVVTAPAATAPAVATVADNPAAATAVVFQLPRFLLTVPVIIVVVALVPTVLDALLNRICAEASDGRTNDRRDQRGLLVVPRAVVAVVALVARTRCGLGRFVRGKAADDGAEDANTDT